MKPTREEHKAHLVSGIGDVCLCCDQELCGRWTDYNGQYQCSYCGMTYQVNGCHLRKEFLEEIGLQKEQVAERYCDEFELLPLVREYFRSTGRPAPLGAYLYPPQGFKEENDLFLRWLADNADRFQSEYPNEFNWEKLKETYSKSQSYAI